MIRQLVLVIVVAVTALGACSKKHDSDETKKMAGLCVEAGDVLRQDAKSASPDTFESLLSSALQACSLACDGDDQPSCKALDDHLHKVCNVMGGVCDSLCKTAHSPSLKQTSCAIAAQGSKR